MKASGGRGDREVGDCSNGGVGVPVRVCEGRAKNGGLLVNKHGQPRDVRAQRSDIPEDGVPNIATFHRGYKSNVATLGSNVTTFQRVVKLTPGR